MNSILFGAGLAALLLLFFAIGFLLGRKTAKAPLLPVQPDDELRQLYEASQKAFEQTMNYSADIAYGKEAF